MSDDENVLHLRISHVPFKIAFRIWEEDGMKKAEALSEDGTLVPVAYEAVKAAIGDPERFQRLPEAEMMAIAAAVARQGRQ